MTTRRLKPEVRRREILAAALPVAAKSWYATVTREDVAQAAGVSGPTILYHFGTMQAFRDALMGFAVHHKHSAVIVQGLITRHPTALGAKDSVKTAALKEMLSA